MTATSNRIPSSHTLMSNRRPTPPPLNLLRFPSEAIVDAVVSRCATDGFAENRDFAALGRRFAVASSPARPLGSPKEAGPCPSREGPFQRKALAFCPSQVVWCEGATGMVWVGDVCALQCQILVNTADRGRIVQERVSPKNTPSACETLTTKQAF